MSPLCRYSVRCGSISQANSAFHPFGVCKLLVIHVITWITGIETIKRQTWAAHGCLVAGQSLWAKPSLLPIGCLCNKSAAAAAVCGLCRWVLYAFAFTHTVADSRGRWEGLRFFFSKNAHSSLCAFAINGDGAETLSSAPPHFQNFQNFCILHWPWTERLRRDTFVAPQAAYFYSGAVCQQIEQAYSLSRSPSPRSRTFDLQPCAALVCRLVVSTPVIRGLLVGTFFPRNFHNCSDPALLFLRPRTLNKCCICSPKTRSGLFLVTRN